MIDPLAVSGRAKAAVRWRDPGRRARNIGAAAVAGTIVLRRAGGDPGTSFQLATPVPPWPA